MAWDKQSARYFEVSTDFCNSANGCKIWGSSTTTLDELGNNLITQLTRYPGITLLDLPTEEASLNTYLNTTFLQNMNQSLQQKIKTHLYNIGFVKLISGQTLAEDVAQEKTVKWRGKIALINASDYIKASTNDLCTGCYEYRGTSDCYSNSDTHNYLFNSLNQWTLTPYEDQNSSSPILFISSKGNVDYNSAYRDNAFGVYPSFHLTSDITLSGKGTEEEPYAIAN